MPELAKCADETAICIYNADVRLIMVTPNLKAYRYNKYNNRLVMIT